MMEYITVITVTTKPGLRFQGIEHLKKFATLLKEKYGISTEILGNMNGAIYRNHLVSRYNGAAQMEETNAKVMADPEWLQWFDEGKELFVWADASQTTFMVH